MAKEEFRFHHKLRVRWAECDAQGIAFNASYMNYLEVAHAEYLRNLGINLYRLAEKGYFDTATVKATLEFKAPARLDQVIDIYTRVSHIGTTSIEMHTEIYAEDSAQLIAEADMIYVAYHASRGTSRQIPDDIRTLMAHFEETGERLPIKDFPNLATTY